MKVAVIGGGPAGLYFSLLLKQARPDADITVLERNRPDDTFGWGVVFSDQTLENFRAADRPTFDRITASFAHWDDIDVHVRGRVITSSGHGFAGIARKKLLQHSAGHDAPSSACACASRPISTSDADLRAARSRRRGRHRRRRRHPQRRPRASRRRSSSPISPSGKARFIWLGTTFPFEAFTFYFVENEHGVFQAHCYRFDEHTSTFIVECDEASWRQAGFDELDLDGTVAACEALFAPWLKGHRLMTNARHLAAPWANFSRVRNASWFHGNIVLIGDAAHTAHFSIGSGTKLAMEDAIALARELAAGRPARRTRSPRIRTSA